MQEFNDLMRSALSAEAVSDDEQEQNYRDQALVFVRSNNAFAVNSIVSDALEGESAESTMVWNDLVKRTTVNVSSPLGGNSTMEIIRPKDSENIFISTNGGMLGGLTGSNGTSEVEYLCLDDESLSDLTNQSTPDGLNEKDHILQIIENGDVRVDGNTVFFEYEASRSDLDWLSADTYKQDVETTGVYSVVTFDLEDRRLESWFESVQNADEPNTQTVSTFLYGESFDFHVPSKSDENVAEVSGGLGGGLGGGVGGMGDLLGGEGDGIADAMDGLTGGSDNSLFSDGPF